MIPIETVFQRFLGIVFPPRTHEVRIQSISLRNLLFLLQVRTISVDSVSITTLLFFKTPAIRSLITEAKFYGSTRAQRLLGQLVAQYIRAYRDTVSLPAVPLVLIPLPLGKARERERGYNQVERIAYYAQKALKSDLANHCLVFSRMLIRTRDTEPQSSLGKKARETNMLGAFRVVQPLDHTFIYVLLDDVVTTGATMKAAETALRRAGAKRLLLLALAH